MNIKIVDRYITKQLIETFIAGIVIFTSIMFASETFITLVKQISTYGIPFNVASLIVILQLPGMLVFTIPMGVLLSTVMTINKMSTSSEITVMRACGIGIDRIARPVFIFGVAAVISCFIINEVIVPAANSQSKILTLWALSQKNIPDGKKNYSFKEMNSQKLKRLFYVSSVENKTLKGVTVLDLSKPNTIQVIQSKYGHTSSESWIFNQGVIYTIATSGKVLNTTLFDDLKLQNTVDMMDSLTNNKEKELNVTNLANYIKVKKNEYKKDNGDLLSHSLMKKRLNQLIIAMYDKFAIPFTAFVYTLIGLPLAITPPRVRYNRGFMFSIAIIFFYYLIRAFSISLGESGIMDPFIAAWLPNIILGLLGLTMLYKKIFCI